MTDAITAELARIEEDAVHSAKSHFEAARAWRHAHYWLGIPTAVLAGMSSASVLMDKAMWGAGISLGVAILAGVSTFLEPGGKGVLHHSSGTRYLSLRNQARTLRTVRLPEMKGEEAVTAVTTLGLDRDRLNETSPPIGRKAFLKAKSGIDAGESMYAVDRPSM